MNGFVVTYGPVPKVWCTRCHNDTPLAAHLDGTLRPGDVDHVQRSHVCGPPTSPWAMEQQGGVSLAARQGGVR